MNISRASIPSITGRARQAQECAGRGGAFWPGVPVFVLGEEGLQWMEGELRRTVVHSGAILASAVDDGSVVTGGDDGKVISTRRDGMSMTLAEDPRGRWIDCVARMAPSRGRQASRHSRAHVMGPRAQSMRLPLLEG
ncbi:MAG: hypothetical protein ABWZ64_11975 [Xanthobacteraceae bacterium]